MTNQLTLRLCPSDGASTVPAAELGRLLIAFDDAVRAFAETPAESASRLSLTGADERGHLLHLDVDGSDGPYDSSISRLISCATVALAGLPYEAELDLRDLQRCIPQDIEAVEVEYGAFSVYIPREESIDDWPSSEPWVAELIDRMTHGEAKPFAPLTDDERIDFDVEEFNRMVAEGRRSSE